MTAAELREIVLSREFKTGLEELSSYLASIMQEGPIVQLLAKCLWKHKQVYALERYKRRDLTIWTPPKGSRTTIEVKFNYETCAGKLSKEVPPFAELAAKLRGRPPEIAAKKTGWAIIPRIYEDVCDKKPDIFVWIICSRDLDFGTLSKNELERIVNWKPLKKHRLLHPYRTDREFLDTVDGFLKILRKFRRFSVLTAEIETKGYFSSIYHFRICEFPSH
jgi:hypothetical protein